MLLRLDYVTFNFAEQSISNLEHLLFGDHSLAFRPVRKSNILDGCNPNDCMSMSPLGLTWKPNNGDCFHPYTLQVSGVGCHHFSPILPLLRFDDRSSNHISRCDLNFDYVMSKSDWREIGMKAENYGYDGQLAKKIVPVGAGYEKTIYIGSRSSPFYFRIYNKTLEDPDYKYLDDLGHVVDLSDDQFVIRFEIELKRFRRTLRSEKQIYDPGVYFDAYYSDNINDLVSDLDELWSSYAKDLLPQGFFDVDVIPYWKVADNGYFVQSVSSSEYEPVIREVIATRFDEPYQFDRVLCYVLDHFGAYVPWIVIDPKKLDRCRSSCKTRFGDVPPFSVEDLRSVSWSEYEDVSSDLDNFFRKEYTQDDYQTLW